MFVFTIVLHLNAADLLQTLCSHSRLDALQRWLYDIRRLGFLLVTVVVCIMFWKWPPVAFIKSKAGQRDKKEKEKKNTHISPSPQGGWRNPPTPPLGHCILKAAPGAVRNTLIRGCSH